MTFRKFLSDKLPAFGIFQIKGEKAPFSGRLYFDENKRKYTISGVLDSKVKGFEEILKAMEAPRSLAQISGDVYGLGYVELINPDGRLSKISSSSLDYYKISFVEMVIQELHKSALPQGISSVSFSSHYISNMWFGNTGFKANLEANDLTRWNTRIYEPQENKILASRPDFTLSLRNHYYENTRFESHCLIEEKVLIIDFSQSTDSYEIISLSQKLARFVQFVSGRMEPFKFLTYTHNQQFFRHYINLKEEGDNRDPSTRKGFLLSYGDIEERSDLIFENWLELENRIAYAMERYSSAYVNLLSDERDNCRIAFVDMCSCLETYYYNYIEDKKEEFKEVIKRLVKEVEHPKIRECFQNDFHLHVANTRHSFIHAIGVKDSRAKYILKPTEIRRYATKLKALFEIIVLKKHFGFSSKKVYLRIARPWLNTLYLDELF